MIEKNDKIKFQLINKCMLTAEGGVGFLYRLSLFIKLTRSLLPFYFQHFVGFLLWMYIVYTLYVDM